VLPNALGSTIHFSFNCLFTKYIISLLLLIKVKVKNILSLFYCIFFFLLLIKVKVKKIIF